MRRGNRQDLLKKKWSLGIGGERISERNEEGRKEGEGELEGTGWLRMVKDREGVPGFMGLARNMALKKSTRMNP